MEAKSKFCRDLFRGQTPLIRVVCVGTGVMFKNALPIPVLAFPIDRMKPFHHTSETDLRYLGVPLVVRREEKKKKGENSTQKSQERKTCAYTL